MTVMDTYPREKQKKEWYSGREKNSESCNIGFYVQFLTTSWQGNRLWCCLRHERIFKTLPIRQRDIVWWFNYNNYENWDWKNPSELSSVLNNKVANGLCGFTCTLLPSIENKPNSPHSYHHDSGLVFWGVQVQKHTITYLKWSWGVQFSAHLNLVKLYTIRYKMHTYSTPEHL